MVTNVIAVDDSPLHLLHIESALSGFKDVHFMAGFGSAEEALEYAAVQKPDLVFADIEMPGCDGFAFAAELARMRIPVVFVTSHDEYALRAFEYQAMHYIIKPASNLKLRECIERIQVSKAALQAATDVGAAVQKDSVAASRIFVSAVGETIVLELKDLLYLKSDGNYTIFKLRNGKRITSSRTLKFYEGMVIAHPDFYRVHRSAIVNKHFIRHIIKDKTLYYVALEDGDRIELALQKKQEFLEWLTR